jgi:hypothetical protein
MPMGSISVPWQRIRLVASYVILFGVIVWTIQWEYVPPGTFGARLNRILQGTYFDFVQWEAQALTGKARQEVISPQGLLDEADRTQLVLDYLDLVSRIHQVEGVISRVYTDPDIDDPEMASQGARAHLAELREQQAKLQGTAEAILEEQISMVLTEEGFGFLGRVLPPVSFRFTPLPNYLIISPRSEIRLMHGVMLRGDIDLEQMEEIEAEIDAAFDVSSLIVPIGGLAVYPAMMYETSSLTWGIGATAHEWVHHYFFFWLTAVGRYYEARPDVRTINETAADLAGAAIKDRVLARYYPEFLPPPASPSPQPDASPSPTPEPPAYDFVAEMRETRVTVDGLLAEGKIDAAESYMEQRRRFFVEHGEALRKLNQAYFAFYGAYASEPGGGAAGSNPIGGPVQELWAASPSIKAFLDALGPVTNRDQLLAILAEKGIAYPPSKTDQN